MQRIARCYPVYQRGYRDRLRPVRQYLSSLEAISVIGRGGAFKYCNQDHAMRMGMLAADRLLSGRRHDLWAVASDDRYQET